MAFISWSVERVLYSTILVPQAVRVHDSDLVQQRPIAGARTGCAWLPTAYDPKPAGEGTLDGSGNPLRGEWADFPTDWRLSWSSVSRGKQRCTDSSVEPETGVEKPCTPAWR